MKPSHGDYRPAERRRYVPSGSPRRKIPVVRVALLLGIALLTYMHFDDYWPRVRQAFSSASPWSGSVAKGSPEGTAQGIAKWSADSSTIALDCPRGIAGACCEALDRASPGLCGEASSLVARARWKGMVGQGASSGRLRVVARAAAEEPQENESARRLALSELAGRDGLGAFALRRRGETRAWCDANRGCLGGRPAPVSPLFDARLETQDSSGSARTALWVSGSRWVRAALPGRVSAVDSVAGGVIVRLYHGFELYTTYGPLQAAPGVRLGAAVKSGSHLGDAPVRGASRALAVRVRRAGRAIDPAEFWNTRPLAAATLTDPATLEATP